MRWPLVVPVALALLAAACGSSDGALRLPEERPPETPLAVADRFLSLWHAEDYGAMYDLLSADSSAKIERAAFVDRYRAIKEEATITGVDYYIPLVVAPDRDSMPATVTIHTDFFGDIVQENSVPLVLEAAPSSQSDKEQWRVEWSPSLIFRELDDRSLVHFFSEVPHRGGIFDRNGRPLAIDGEAPVVGIVSSLAEDTETLVHALAPALKMSEAEVRAKVEADVPPYFFIPIKTLPPGTTEEELTPFYAMVDLGVVLRTEVKRTYPQGDSAAHVLGQMGEPDAEMLAELADKGYRAGDLVGLSGLEGNLEEVLAGERGATLATISPDGAIGLTIAEKSPTPGYDVHLSLDIDAQKAAEAALGERVGSVVVMDPRDNSVLALASYPRLDPNAFIAGLSEEEFARLSGDERDPFLNRPLLATYPTGSTFKVVTMAAGLEQGGFTPESRLPCPPVWTGLGSEFPRKNWQSVDRGYLTLAEGLMASCNPVFYEIALTLDHIEENILPLFARAFGFGQPTGINGLEEAAGLAPSPQWKEETLGEPWYSGDSVNMAIGQGYVTATPLQIANMYSAIAGDGVLRTPLLVRSTTDRTGAVVEQFEAQEINPLPVSATTLDAIRYGLTLVTQNPGGTAYGVFSGSGLDAAGKSGTAEDLAFGSDHVFFVAYAPSADPSVLVLAALERGQAASAEAGPIVRDVLRAYLPGHQ
jgi:penicillin-binding protein 2